MRNPMAMCCFCVVLCETHVCAYSGSCFMPLSHGGRGLIQSAQNSEIGCNLNWGRQVARARSKLFSLLDIRSETLNFLCECEPCHLKFQWTQKPLLSSQWHHESCQMQPWMASIPQYCTCTLFLLKLHGIGALF